MKYLNPGKIDIIPATIADYPTIQNMARFYVYDRSGYMGWGCEEDGMFACIDFKHYFEHPEKEAFLVKVGAELAGFVLLDKVHLVEAVDWNMGEFFIIAKFHGKGVASQVAKQIFKAHPGKWSIAFMPDNLKAERFWHRVIADISGGNYTEVFKSADDLKTSGHPDPDAMSILSFDTKVSEKAKPLPSLRKAVSHDVADMVAFSCIKRLAYSKAQPQFWKYADGAEEIQNKWFNELLSKDDYIMLVSENQAAINGFIIGCIVNPPEVYDAGLTVMVDDFCVADDNWFTVGGQLVAELKTIAKQQGAGQLLVVCGAHDATKRKFLKSLDLSVASEWFVGGIE
jgi:predicted acetyltransferase